LLEDLLERSRGNAAEPPVEDGATAGDDPADASVEASAAAAGLASAMREELDRLLDRVDADRVAYQFVSRRLQKQKDLALVAGLKTLVEELGHVGKGLFAAYRTIIAFSRDAAALCEERHDGEVVQAEELFREASQAEVEAERRSTESSDQVCLRALRRLRDGDTNVATRDATRRVQKSAKSHSKALAVIAAVLLPVSLWVNLDLTRTKGPAAVTYADFASGLNVSDFGAADRMLYVQVNGWQLLDVVQRRTRAESLAAIAVAKGYTRMLVIEEHGFAAASWTPDEGTRLTATELHNAPQH
jgi:hypothetical protein